MDRLREIDGIERLACMRCSVLYSSMSLQAAIAELYRRQRDLKLEPSYELWSYGR